MKVLWPPTWLRRVSVEATWSRDQNYTSIAAIVCYGYPYDRPYLHSKQRWYGTIPYLPYRYHDLLG